MWICPNCGSLSSPDPKNACVVCSAQMCPHCFNLDAYDIWCADCSAQQLEEILNESERNKKESSNGM